METQRTKIFIVIPVFNEGPVIAKVIKQIITAGYSNVIVIDDGSEDNSYTESVQAGAQTLRHKLNRGKGAAVKTGIEAAIYLGADIVVTMDGDGQHLPEDIKKLTDPIKAGYCDVSLGFRPFENKTMPTYKILANHIANGLTWAIHGLLVTDSQSGFRAYSKNAARLIDTRSDRYEYDSAVLQEIRKHNLSYLEVPIGVKYTSYSTSKTNRQNLSNGIRTLYKMVWNRIA